MKRYKKGILIGRFQPFHLGHLEYINRILKECEMLVIIIGSSQEKRTPKNPFSAKERKKMINSSLRKIPGIMQRIAIMAMRDYPGDNEKWAKRVIKKAGNFDILFAGQNKLVKRLFAERGFAVSSSERIKGISGTKIRKLRVQKKRWEHLVPAGTLMVIDEISQKKENQF